MKTLQNVGYYVAVLRESKTSNGKEFPELTDTLTALSKTIEEECNDNELLNAKTAKEKAIAEYNRQLTKVLKANEQYCKVEDYITHVAVSALGPDVLKWYNEYSEYIDRREKEINTLQKIASWLQGIHKKYLDSKSDASKVTKARKNKEEKRKALLAALAALDLE